MGFEFATATRILVGAGVLQEAGTIAKGYGERALVVTGRLVDRAEPLLCLLRRSGLAAETFSVGGEPELDTVTRGTSLARQRECDLVIAFGGGSALDAGKAIAAMLTNPGGVLDYLEVIGGGRVLGFPSAPFIAIPTTAGTGSEVTRNAVLASPHHRVKVSLRSPHLLPRAALVDPELTYGLPPAITATTGLDALTQLIEPYVSLRANPVTDALCVEGIRRAARSLRIAVASGRDRAAREDMSVASLFSGIALTNAGLGAVHGFAGPIGGWFSAPHGAVCAALLPHVMTANVEALRQRNPASPALRRYDEIARLLTSESAVTADAGATWVRRLVAELGIPGLSAYGIDRGHSAELVTNASRASSMKANPIELKTQELTTILEAAL